LGNDDFQRSKTPACDFVRDVGGALTNGFTYIAEQDFCPGADDDTCIVIVDMLVDAAGAILDLVLVNNCPAAFDAIFVECQGNVGGPADITITRNDGQTARGFLGAMTFEDNTETCPANPITDTKICKMELAG
jgi:hypothetical protein